MRHAGARELKERVKGGPVERLLLCGPLDLHEPAIASANDVEVNIGTAVLFVRKVEHWSTANDPHGDCGDVSCQVRLNPLLAHREGEGDPAAGDARATGAAVGDQHVAVDQDRALTELL